MVRLIELSSELEFKLDILGDESPRIAEVLMETILGVGGKRDIISNASLTQNEALDAGIKWVGENPIDEMKKDRNGRLNGIITSANQRRQFRIDYGSINGDHPQVIPLGQSGKEHVHFEVRTNSNSGKVLINNHVFLRK